MASLRKKERSPYWFACFTLPDGQRVQRSAKETARKAAQKKADDWEKLSKERAKARQAQQVIAEIYRIAHAEELPDATPRAFIKGWIARRRGEIAQTTFESYDARSKHFLEWLGEAADRPLAELETRQFIAYWDKLVEGLAPSTVNHANRILRIIFEDARCDGFIPDTPAEDCGMLKKPRGSTRRPFTLDEIRIVMKVANDEWRSMVVFALYTGLRLSDVAELTWSNIDTEIWEIHVETKKPRRIVRVPVCDPLKNHIESFPADDNPSSPIHPKAILAGRSTLSRQFLELLADAGLRTNAKHEAKGKGRGAGRTREAFGNERM